MKEIRRIIENAKAGTIVPVVEELPYALDPVDYFAKLSEYGNKKNCILLESADIITKYGERSLGSAEPCLKIEGKQEDFEITALNDIGKRFIQLLKNDFDFCDEIIYGHEKITGCLKPKAISGDENARLKAVSHMDIIRKIAFKFKPTSKPFVPYAGLFGYISYDFIDHFEELPQNKEDIIKDKDYVFYFLDSMFLIDHKANKTYFIANALIGENRKKIYGECIEKIRTYNELVNKKIPKIISGKKAPLKIKSDTSKEEFMELVKKAKKHILQGDVYQLVLSRTITANLTKEPLDIYKRLRKLNPSPYMFYVNDGTGILLGASPEMSLRVEGNERKIAEIRPIAGTKPRGAIMGKIDLDLDSRYENELKTDGKEISEHIMLVDLARNDIARISEPGTRYVNEPFVIEKYSHVQHLVSNVRGLMKKDLDALHAYVATMNMGTLTGAPKVEAMKLIRKYEKTKRGFYGGAIGYITPDGDMDTAIIIRSMRIKNNTVYIRAGAGIVYDSNPESEFIETERKAAACLKALEEGD